jgi:hypothetical protein
MKKICSLVSIALLALAPAATFADNNASSKQAPTPLAKAVFQQKAGKVVRLSDVELDKISAGTAEVTTGGGLTIIVNPGNADVFKLNKHGHLLCINC